MPTSDRPPASGSGSDRLTHLFVLDNQPIAFRPPADPKVEEPLVGCHDLRTVPVGHQLIAERRTEGLRRCNLLHPPIRAQFPLMARNRPSPSAASMSVMPPNHALGAEPPWGNTRQSVIAPGNVWFRIVSRPGQGGLTGASRSKPKNPQFTHWVMCRPSRPLCAMSGMRR